MSEATRLPRRGILRAPTGAALDAEFPRLLDTEESDYWIIIDMSADHIAINTGCDPECKESDLEAGIDFSDLLVAVAPYLAIPEPEPCDVPYTELEPAHSMDRPIEGGYRVTARGLEIRIAKTAPWPVTVTTWMPIPELLTAIAAMVAREEGA